MASSSQKASGFANEQIYNIMSIKHSKYVEIEGDQMEPGAKVIVGSSTNGSKDGQKFLTKEQDDGTFHVSSVLQCSEVDGEQCWDFTLDNTLLIQNTCAGNPTQLWTAEEIVPRTGVCLIYSPISMKYLQSKGAKKQIHVVSIDRSKAVNDKTFQWRLEPASIF